MIRRLVNEDKCAWIKIPWENQQKPKRALRKSNRRGQTGGARN